MQCPRCHRSNPSESKFCMECGIRLENICANCGTKLPLEAKFCVECGIQVVEAISVPHHQAFAPKLEDLREQLQSLIPEALAQKYLTAQQQSTEENRLITALFVDISGFTQLSTTRSSEEMFQLVQDCFKQLVKIVANYEGSISGFRGDGLLALFGAPIMHENDAERAILAAFDMRNTMREQLGESRKDWRLQGLKGMGRICFNVGNAVQAEEWFRKAIILGREIGLPTEEVVRLYYWLGEAMLWQSKYNEMIQLGEEGLALLGDQKESSGAGALMYLMIGGGYQFQGDFITPRAFHLEIVKFLDRLPYSEDLRYVYVLPVVGYANDKNNEEGIKWLQIWEPLAEQHHDLLALSEIQMRKGELAFSDGDLHGAILCNQRSVEIARKIGNPRLVYWRLNEIGWSFLWLGDLQKAEEHALEVLKHEDETGYDKFQASGQRNKREIRNILHGMHRKSRCDNW